MHPTTTRGRAHPRSALLALALLTFAAERVLPPHSRIDALADSGGPSAQVAVRDSRASDREPSRAGTVIVAHDEPVLPDVGVEWIPLSEGADWHELEVVEKPSAVRGASFGTYGSPDLDRNGRFLQLASVAWDGDAWDEGALGHGQRDATVWRVTPSIWIIEPGDTKLPHLVVEPVPASTHFISFTLEGEELTDATIEHDLARNYYTQTISGRLSPPISVPVAGERTIGIFADEGTEAAATLVLEPGEPAPEFLDLTRGARARFLHVIRPTLEPVQGVAVLVDGEFREVTGVDGVAPVLLRTEDRSIELFDGTTRQSFPIGTVVDFGPLLGTIQLEF